MEINKLIQKCKWKAKDREQGIQHKNKVRELILPDFKTYNKSHQDHMVQGKDKQISGRGVEKQTYTKYSQFIFDKGVKTIQWRNGRLFNKWY